MLLFKIALIFTAAWRAQAQSDGSCAPTLQSVQLTNQTYVLPNPFTLVDGTPVRTSADWSCRAQQLRSLFQQYELGQKPPRPPIVRVSFGSNVLNITAGAGTVGPVGKNSTVTFSVPISYPNVTTGMGRGLGPMPAIITFNALSVPRPAGAAVLSLDVGAIAQQNGAAVSRGKGLFYDLYGANSSAGALMAWAWATSLIVDALEMTPEAGIDPASLAVTGCSRNGKGAMVAGAFEERIALTIPQESGSGGDGCWRVSRDMLVNDNQATQTAWEIVTEDPWFSPAFQPFAANNYSVGTLPVDHHELAGLIAPRGLYSTSNVGFLWLGGESPYQCMSAANKIFEALGVKNNHGFSQDGPHPHCSFPDDQVAEIQAFYDKFLFGKMNANTSVFRTVGNWTVDSSWVPWSAPTF